jgi:hypothetical protein
MVYIEHRVEAIVKMYEHSTFLFWRHQSALLYPLYTVFSTLHSKQQEYKPQSTFIPSAVVKGCNFQHFIAPTDCTSQGDQEYKYRNKHNKLHNIFSTS